MSKLRYSLKTIKGLIGHDDSYSSLDDLLPVWGRLGIYAFKAKITGKDMFQNNTWKVKLYRGHGVSDNGTGSSILDAAIIATAFAIKEVESEQDNK